MENRYGNLDRKRERSGFSFNYVRELPIKCGKVHEAKGSPDSLKCKKATINLKSIDDCCFQYAFTLTQHSRNQKSSWANIKY